MKKMSKICEHAKEGRWIGFDNTRKGHQIYWPTWGTTSVEYNINFTPAPDLPPLKGEIGDIYFDFNKPQEPSNISIKTIEVHQEDVLGTGYKFN